MTRGRTALFWTTVIVVGVVVYFLLREPMRDMPPNAMLGISSGMAVASIAFALWVRRKKTER